MCILIGMGKLTHDDEVCRRWKLREQSVLSKWGALLHCCEQRAQVRLTEDRSWSIITGKTGFTHSGTANSQSWSLRSRLAPSVEPVANVSKSFEDTGWRLHICRSRLDVPIVDNESCNFFYMIAKDPISIVPSLQMVAGKCRSMLVLVNRGLRMILRVSLPSMAMARGGRGEYWRVECVYE